MNTISNNAEQQNNWNALASAWERWGDIFEQGAATVTEIMLRMADLREGWQVLDVATGLGEPALSAAQRVGARGRVTALDIAEEMIAVARRRGAAIPNLEFVSADVETYSEHGTYDLVLSRFGLMFLSQRQATLRRLFEALNPGGKIVFSTWSTPDKVPVISLGVGFFVRELNLPPPPPGKPNPFCMADPAAVNTELQTAGFGHVTWESAALGFPFDTPAAFVEFQRSLIPPSIAQAIAERATPEQVEGLWQKFAGNLERFIQPSGKLLLPASALCFAATRAAHS